MKAIQALNEAQKIAFSPFVFQAVCAMRDLGILNALNNANDGMSVGEISSATGVSDYGVQVLVEMAAISGVLDVDSEEKYTLTKVGYFLLRDEMTEVNLDFTRKVCYGGLEYLTDAIRTGKPEGLKVLGSWETLYRGLSEFPEEVKTAWFRFDHFYSDNSFDEALKIIFRDKPKMIFDIGGNTGKWAIACTRYDEEVRVRIFDLPGQLKVAQRNVSEIASIADRVEFQEIDMLNEASEIPAGADVYWMSQFLDCFSEGEIEQILRKIRKNASPQARIFIMETFIDQQKFPAASFSLMATSLYFTVMANGNSKMYSSTAMKKIIDKAGLSCRGEFLLQEKGSFHTILEVSLPE